METLPAARAVRIVLIPEVLPPRVRRVASSEPPYRSEDYPPAPLADPVGLVLDVYV